MWIVFSSKAQSISSAIDILVEFTITPDCLTTE